MIFFIKNFFQKVLTDILFYYQKKDSDIIYTLNHYVFNKPRNYIRSTIFCWVLNK